MTENTNSQRSYRTVQFVQVLVDWRDKAPASYCSALLRLAPPAGVF